MANITQICTAAYSILFDYMESVGNPLGMKPWESIPDWQKNALIKVADHLGTTESSVGANHDYWVKVALSEGWTYGDKLDVSQKKSPYVRTWSDLDYDIRLYETIFVTSFNSIKRIISPKGPSAREWDAIRVGDLNQRVFDAFHMEKNTSYFLGIYKKTGHDLQWIRSSLMKATVGRVKQGFGIP